MSGAVDKEERLMTKRGDGPALAAWPMRVIDEACAGIRATTGAGNRAGAARAAHGGEEGGDGQPGPPRTRLSLSTEHNVHGTPRVPDM